MNTYQVEHYWPGITRPTLYRAQARNARAAIASALPDYRPHGIWKYKAGGRTVTRVNFGNVPVSYAFAFRV